MISKEKKAEIIAAYGRTPEDTGSPEVQIAILTARIAELTSSSGEPEGSSFQKRSADDGRTEKRYAGLLKEQGYRGLPYLNREVRY